MLKDKKKPKSGFITEEKENEIMKKTPTVYICILSVWAVCAGVLLFSCGQLIYGVLQGENVTGKAWLVAILLALNAGMLAYMWLGSVKDFMFSLLFLITGKRLMKRYQPILEQPLPEKHPKFLLLYCTCNDFNAEALKECMAQDYDNFETVILDDSSKEEYQTKIDKFAKKYGAKVVRRQDRKGFKAGNLNHYLQGKTDYDYFVVLDSDERIPADYIQETLRYFVYDENVGVVQAAHKATKGSNLFQGLMGLSVKSNGKICQVMKNFYGSNALIGHGMAISRKCFEAVKGFPEVVAEDISFAVDVKNSGYRVLYAPNIVCREEFPVNYLCLKKRQAKWVQGNVEFMKKYNRSITESKMTWYERLDIRLSHYNLPIIPMLSFLLIINTICMGFLGFDVGRYSLMLVGLMLLFLVSPLIPDFFVHGKEKNVFRLIGYAFLNFVVYASLVPMMIGTVLLALLGKKAKFIVTPKEERRISVKEAFRGSVDSIVFAFIVGILTYGTYFSFAPSALIVLCCALTPMAILVANVPAK